MKKIMSMLSLLLCSPLVLQITAFASSSSGGARSSNPAVQRVLDAIQPYLMPAFIVLALLFALLWTRDQEKIKKERAEAQKKLAEQEDARLRELWGDQTPPEYANSSNIPWADPPERRKKSGKQPDNADNAERAGEQASGGEQPAASAPEESVSQGEGKDGSAPSAE